MTQAGGVSREVYLANKDEIRSCSVLRSLASHASRSRRRGLHVSPFDKSTVLS